MTSRYFTTDLAYALSPDEIPATAPQQPHHEELPILTQIRKASPTELGEIIKALQAKVNEWTKDAKPLTYGQHKSVQRKMAAWIHRQEWEINAQFPDLDIKLPRVKKASPPLQERSQNQMSAPYGNQVQHPSWQWPKPNQSRQSYKRPHQQDYEYPYHGHYHGNGYQQVKRQRHW